MLSTASMVLSLSGYMTKTALGEDIPADSKTAGLDPSPYKTGKPSFVAAY